MRKKTHSKLKPKILEIQIKLAQIAVLRIRDQRTIKFERFLHSKIEISDDFNVKVFAIDFILQIFQYSVLPLKIKFQLRIKQCVTY